MKKMKFDGSQIVEVISHYKRKIDGPGTWNGAKHFDSPLMNDMKSSLYSEHIKPKVIRCITTILRTRPVERKNKRNTMNY